MTEIQNPK